MGDNTRAVAINVCVKGEPNCKDIFDDEDKKSVESSESSDGGVGNQYNNERPAWDNKFQYIMAALGFAVGLGNIWRFPYLCHKNGGGAFLIPYFLMLLIMGYPLYFLELCAGQSIRQGAVGVWSSVDGRLVGIGFASIVVSLLIGLYYNVILAWTLYYFVNSFQAKLPWSECPVVNDTVVPECAASSPTDYFWYRNTLDISSSIEEGGTINWKMAVALLIAWFLVFLGIIKGIKSSGKVMYFATMFPYIILIAFFVRGMTLEGAVAGVQHMFKPDVAKLIDVNVWREAATQIFFSLGLGYGAIIAYSSYNPIHNNCKKDATFVATANSLTSVFACITVFSVLGHKAQMEVNDCEQRNLQLLNGSVEIEQHKFSHYDLFLEEVRRINQTNPQLIKSFPITNWNCSLEEELKVIGQGTGLAFIAFADAIVSFPASPVWAVLFFLMLFCIGVSSIFGILQAFITMVLDLPCKVSKLKLTSVLCTVMFLIGLIFTTRCGSYFLDLFDGYAATFGLVAVALMECVAVAWIYGYDNFARDIENMIQSEPGIYWKISWKFTCPLAMVIILVISFINLFLEYPTYKAWLPTGTAIKLAYPPWAIVLIVFLILSSILCIPIFALLVHFGKFDPKIVGVHSAGKNRRGESKDQAGPTESTTPLTSSKV